MIEPASPTPAPEIQPELHDEIEISAAPPCAVATIEPATVTDCAEAPIASPEPSYEVSLENPTIVPRESKVTDCDEVIEHMTFAQSMAAHSRRYLESVLRQTGGERRRAAELAGVGRTHLQALIKRFGVDVAMNPKARGRRSVR